MGLWDVVVSVAQAAADTVEAVVEVVVETVEDVVETVADAVTGFLNGISDWINTALAGAFFFIAAFLTIVIGAANGIVGTFLATIGGLVRAVSAVLNAIAALLRGDLVGFLMGLLTALLELALVVVAFFTLPMRAYKGIVEQIQRDGLRKFVSDLIDRSFEGEDRATARSRAGLDTGVFGLTIPAKYRIAMMDSANTSLRLLHQQDLINLHDLANHFPGTFRYGRTLVKRVSEDGTDHLLEAHPWEISDYLENEGSSVRLRAYALKTSVAVEHMRKAKRKLRKAGLELLWDAPGEYLHLGGVQTVELTIPAEEDGTFSDRSKRILRSDFSGDNLRRDFLTETVSSDGVPLKSAERMSERELLCLGAFDIIVGETRKLSGVTYGRGGRQGDDCPIVVTEGRDDACCQTVPRGPDLESLGSFCVARDEFYGNPFILVHEIGHYYGLCHFGHGVNDIMFTVEPDQGTGVGNPLHYVWATEPEFSDQNARNIWRFIVDQLPELLRDPEHVVTVTVIPPDD